MRIPDGPPETQLARLRLCFAERLGRRRVDDRPTLSEFVFINGNGLRWRDAPMEAGPAETSAIVINGEAITVSSPGSWSAWPPWHGSEDDHNRCSVSEGASHNLYHVCENRGHGRQAGETIGVCTQNSSRHRCEWQAHPLLDGGRAGRRSRQQSGVFGKLPATRSVFNAG